MARASAAFAALGAPPSTTALFTCFSRASGVIGNNSSASSSSMYCFREGGGGVLRKYSAGAQQLHTSRVLQEQRRILQWLLTSPSLGEPQPQLQQHQVESHYLCGGRLSSSERAAVTRERLRHRLQQRRCFSSAASDSSETKYSRTPSGSQDEGASLKTGGTERSSKPSGTRQYDSSTGRSDTQFSYSIDPEKQRKVLESVRRGDAEPSGPGYTFKGTPLQPDELSRERLEKLQQGDTSYYTAAPEDVAAHEAASVSAGGDSTTVGAATKRAASEIGAAGARVVRENAENMTEKVKEGAGALSTAAKESLSGAAENIKEGAITAKDTMKEKATAATDTVREGAAAAGRTIRNTAGKSAATAGAAAAALPGGSRFANASLCSKLLLAGGAGLLLYSLWGGCSLMRETDALRTAWEYIKKDEQVKAQMGTDFTRERWWGGYEHDDAARVKLRLRGRHGEKGLAVCDLTREHPKAPWKVLRVSFVRTDNSASPPSPPERQQVQGYPPPSSSSQQQPPAQPQHLQQEQPYGAPHQERLEEEIRREQFIAEGKKQQKLAQKQGAEQQHQRSKEEEAAQERQRKAGEEGKRQEGKKTEPQELQRKAEDEKKQHLQEEIEAQERQRNAEKEDEEKRKQPQKQEEEIQQRHVEETQPQHPTQENKGQRVQRERADQHQKAKEDQQQLRREDADTQQRHRIENEVEHRDRRREEEEMHDRPESEREATALKAQGETQEQKRITNGYDERRQRQEQEQAQQHRNKAKEGQRQYQHPGIGALQPRPPEDVERRQHDAVHGRGQKHTDLQEQQLHDGGMEVPAIAQAHGDVPQRVKGVEKHATDKEGETEPALREVQPSHHKGHGRTLEASRQPREGCAVPRDDEDEEELFRRRGYDAPLHSVNRMQAQKLSSVPRDAFTPPLEEQTTLPWKVKAMQRDASLKGKSEWGSGPVPPPGPYTRP